VKKLLAGAAALAVCAAAVPAYAGTRSVKVDDNVFSPRSATIAKGDTVRFRWVGRAPHNVKVVSGPAKFGSSVQKSGSYRRKLTKAGTYRIVCTIHPGMRMTLRVRR
jgi:plastocyanin